jgi:hypothetical protein
LNLAPIDDPHPSTWKSKIASGPHLQVPTLIAQSCNFVPSYGRVSFLLEFANIFGKEVKAYSPIVYPIFHAS